MIIDLAFDSYFWLSLAGLLIGGCWIISARPMDFPFFVVLVLSQYAVHTWLAFGLNNPLTVFSFLFLIVFLAAAGRGKSATVALHPLTAMERDWIALAKAYLFLYYSARLIFYPFMGGELLLDERLAAQQRNPLIFTLGLAVQPALAAFMYSWVRPGGRFSKLDLIILFLVALGLVGSGSKGGVITFVLTYLGVASYLERQVLRDKKIVLAGATVIGLTVYVLTRLFPDAELSGIGLLIVYRLAANTDSVEYLYNDGINPGDYPYAGVGALFPMLFKRVGYAFEYPPGVWLHGTRFGDWSGFGPNPGILMDYYGNLGWFGLAAALGIGLYVHRARLSRSVVGCSFLAAALMLVVDVGIFDITVIVWGGLYLLLCLKHSWRALRSSPGIRVNI